ncbi:MAG: lytic transglycosylase, partial [Hyphomicrobiales bacterium]
MMEPVNRHMQVNQQPATSDAIRRSIKSASLKTGVDFGFLLNTAMRESSLQVGAQSSASSATGLFQFIESTWLETLKQDGPQHGLDRYARQISKLSNGRYVVNDPVIRDEILNLRSDPEIASIMAGALT